MYKCCCLFFLLLAGLALPARCCDVCGCYTPQALEPLRTEEAVLSLDQARQVAAAWVRGPYVAVAEQFTHFGTLQLDGDEVANSTDQHLDSSITQFVLGYVVNSRFALQINLPLIYRSFQRPEGFAIDHGTESGLGDMSLLAAFTLIHLEKGGGRSVAFEEGKSPQMQVTDPDLSFSLGLLGGLKMPTGATGRLKEEFHEIDVPGAPPSGIHGHDLTLGTGSWDGIFGGQGSLRYKSAFLLADLQFTLRGDGAHQYHFANDLAWSTGPGYYVLRTSRGVLGVQVVVSGEYKDVDRFRGKVAEDTGITSVFVGPRVVAGLGKLTAEIEADFPASIDNTALQAVPDYRLRGGISFHF